MGNLTLSQVLPLVAPLIVVELGLVIFALIKLKNDKVRFLPKWAWVIIIILFAETFCLGPILYLVIGREKD